MSPQHVFTRRCIVALLAFVWVFSTVLFQMCPQLVCPRRCKVTLVTFVWLFSTVRFWCVLKLPTSEDAKSHCIVLIYLRYVFWNVSSNGLLEKIYVGRSSCHHFFFLHTGSPLSILTGFFKITGGDGEGLEGGGGEGEDGGWGGAGKCERGWRGEGGVSSVAPSNWLKEVQVLALLLMTITQRLVGTGLGGRGGGGSTGAVVGGGASWSTGFSLLCVFICLLKWPVREDAKSHWLHFFDLM